MNEPLTDDELLSLLSRERSAARDFITGQIGFERRVAYEYYYGKPFGNEEQGRSQVVSQLVAEVIDSALPDIIKVFAGSDAAVQCEPRGEEDVEAAQQATDVCNYVFWTQNNGFLLLYEGIKDALLQKTGVWKYYWDKETKVVTESYNGLTLDQITLLQQDTQIEIIGANSYPDPTSAGAAAPGALGGQGMQPGLTTPDAAQAGGMPAPIPMLYDVKVRTKKEVGKVCIDCIAPEEVYVSPRARSVDTQTIPYIGIRTRKTLSDLVSMGYPADQVLELHSESMGEDWSEERIARVQRTGTTEFAGEDHTDNANPMMREVWYNEEYILVDADGDGIAERRVCCSVGDTLLHNEVIERVPLAVITPKIMPHEFFGVSLADDTMDLQLLKSTLWRMGLDGTYATITPRTIVLDGQANIDDLLSPVPGQVIREYAPGAVRPFEIDKGAAQQAFQMIEFLEQETQGRTGVDRYGNAPSLNPDSLNKTLGGANIALMKSQARLELICRTFAETGVKQLFQGILWLLSKYQDKAMVMRVRNKWVNVDPRAWKNEYDFVVNVGLGTGSKDQQMAHMMMFGQVIQGAAQMGCVTPKNAYNFAHEYGKLLGFKDANKYVTDPTAPETPDNPKPPPQEPPEVQVEKIKAQTTTQIEQAKGQAKLQVEMAQMQADKEVEMAKAQASAALDLEKTKHQAELDMVKHGREAEKAVQIEHIKAAAQIEVARISAMISDGTDMARANAVAAGMPDAVDPVAELRKEMQGHIDEIKQQMSKPKRHRIVRSPDGKAVGVEQLP